jgi:hypothetical protein
MKPEEKLERHIRALVEIDPTDSLMISCFVNLEHPRANYAIDLETQIQKLRRQLSGDQLEELEAGFATIKAFLKEVQAPKTRGAAIYLRGGETPFYLTMEFEVPLETELFLDELPHIYPLIALKDTYHRFVTVITTERGARIFETTLGAVTEEILTERKELRKRIGREWTREHYQNHKREREQQLVREKIQVIDELMRRRGHNHLVIAGSPAMVGRMTAALPPRLKEKLISTVNSNPNSGVNPILLEAVQLFVEAENAESHDRVRKLRRELMSTGLAVAGFEESKSALEGGYADLLIIDTDVFEAREREQLMHLATAKGVGVETVNGSDILKRLRGVGCLLRYRPNGIASPQEPELMPV